MDRKTVSTNVTPEEWRLLDQHATNVGKSLSQVFFELLKPLLKRLKEEQGAKNN